MLLPEKAAKSRGKLGNKSYCSVSLRFDFGSNRFSDLDEPMVLIFDGNTETGTHVWKILFY